MKLRTLLAATDLSAPAQHAVARAFRIASGNGAKLELMHVVSQGGLDGLSKLLGIRAAEVETRILDQARNALALLSSDLGQKFGVSAGMHLVAGNVLNAFLIWRMGAMPTCW